MDATSTAYVLSDLHSLVVIGYILVTLMTIDFVRRLIKPSRI